MSSHDNVQHISRPFINKLCRQLHEHQIENAIDTITTERCVYSDCKRCPIVCKLVKREMYDASHLEVLDEVCIACRGSGTVYFDGEGLECPCTW